MFIFMNGRMVLTVNYGRAFSVKDGPVYPLLKEAIKEALKRHSLVLTELSSSYYGRFADISVMSLS